MEFFADKLYLISIMALPFLLAVTLHEAGHALAATKFGDPTPRLDGRLSLNPLVHMDPIGTVAIPLVAVLTGFPFLIGYAKPVMIQPANFKGNRKTAMIVTAAAGPFGNLVVAIACAYVLRFAIGFGADGNDWIAQTMFYGVFMNCLFMVFNLLPIPPLDGGGIVEQLLPRELAQSYRSIAPYGFFILIGIIVVARDIIIVPTQFMTGLVLWAANVPI